jgi:chemotaxis protein CheD
MNRIVVNAQRAVESLAMGQIGVAKDEGALRTLLGSCVGLALYDRRLRAGALAHIVLPYSLGRVEHPGKFADTAAGAMVERLQALTGQERLRLEAKLAGGANMFGASESASTIGAQNVAAVERALSDLRIPIAARHCGGEQGRKMTLYLASGLVTLEIVGATTVTL